MGNLTLNGATSGQITLAPPAVAGTNTISLPAQTATVLTDSSAAMNIGSGQIYKDASGNVGIGTSSPQAKIHAAVTSGSGTATEVARFSGSANGAGSGALIRFTNTGSGTNPGPSQYNTGGISAVDDTNNFGGALLFYTPNSGVSGGGNLNERMRIDSSGNLMVGKTVTGFGVRGVEISGNTIGGQQSWTGTNDLTRTVVNTGGGTSGNYASHLYYFNNTSTLVGYISHTNSSTAYNTSSDYRLKENVQPITTGLAKISALKPVTYDWISDKSAGEGFIAHELQEIIPLAVTGEKDAVDDEGNIKPQGVDYSKIVVHLVAAMQEQQSIIEDLKARLAVLEAK